MREKVILFLIVSSVLSACKGSGPVTITSSWSNNYNAEAIIPFSSSVTKWLLKIMFSNPISAFTVFSDLNVVQNVNNQIFVIQSGKSTSLQNKGSTFKIQVQVTHNYGNTHPTATWTFTSDPMAATTSLLKASTAFDISTFDYSSARSTVSTQLLSTLTTPQTSLASSQNTSTLTNKQSTEASTQASTLLSTLATARNGMTTNTDASTETSQHPNRFSTQTTNTASRIYSSPFGTTFFQSLGTGCHVPVYARQHSTFNDAYARFGIDGSLNTCSVTGKSILTWFEIRLKCAANISSVVITGQGISNLMVRVSSTPLALRPVNRSGGQLCKLIHNITDDVARVTITCDLPISGNYVYIHTIQSRPSHLVICDFIVM